MSPIIDQPVLLADIGEVFGAVAALIGLFLWIVQKVAEGKKAAAQPQPQPPRAAAPPAANAPAAGQQADPLRSQVEEFLRRAGQAQQPANQPAARKRQPAQAVRETKTRLGESSPAPERRRLSQPLRPIEPLRDKATPAAPPSERRSVAPPKRKSLAERSAERAAARSRSIAQQASKLGQRIIAEDQEFDEQLKAKFDHAVGTLADTSAASSEPVLTKQDTPAAQIAAMLANPDGVRQAIILNEVLRRPTDRW